MGKMGEVGKREKWADKNVSCFWRRWSRAEKLSARIEKVESFL
jgi:hypothetical protein